MPSNESVKQELRIIAGALFNRSRLSGRESFMIKTPALAALHDEEKFTQITNMPPTVLSHHVGKLLNVHLTVHPGNMNPFTGNVWAVDHAVEGQPFFCLGDQINIPENGGAVFLLFAIILPELPPRHRFEEEYTLMSSMSSILAKIETKKILWCSNFKAMRRAWHCQGHKHITQSVVDHIMAAATAANNEVLKIALPPLCFKGAVDFAESILHMIWAIFAQLGHELNEYSRLDMQFNGLGDGIFE